MTVPIDSDRFSRLFETYHRRLWGFVRSRVGPSLADDVCGDVWQKAWRSFASFTGDDEAFRHWLFTIARNRGHDLGKQKDRSHQSLEGAEIEVTAAVEPADDARLAALRTCWEMLAAEKPDFANVTRDFYGGMSYEELGRHYSIPIDTVGSRISRARKSLEQCVKGKIE